GDGAASIAAGILTWPVHAATIVLRRLAARRQQPNDRVVRAAAELLSRTRGPAALVRLARAGGPPRAAAWAPPGGAGGERVRGATRGSAAGTGSTRGDARAADHLVESSAARVHGLRERWTARAGAGTEVLHVAIRSGHVLVAAPDQITCHAPDGGVLWR